jgi:hypothetical protein
MTYGKNLMGSYSSQLDRKQRWMVAQYIKFKQQAAKGGSGSGGGTSDSTGTTGQTATSQATAKK